MAINLWDVIVLVVSLVILVPLVISGTYSFIIGLKRLSRKKLIENTPTSKIRSLAMGLVEVFGKAVTYKEKWKAPLTNNDCLYHRWQIAEYRSSGKSGGKWVTIAEDKKEALFYLKDETGAVLVDPAGADVDILPYVTVQSGLRLDPPEEIKRFLASRGISYKGLLGINRQMRFIEWHIAPGDKLYVMGTAGDNPLVDDAKAVKGSEDIMIKRGEYEKFYYISDRPEKEILNSLRQRALLYMIGGVAGIVAGVIILTYLF